MIDFLIVGAGLFGSVFAREMTDKGYKCLVIDRRDHIGGNCYTERIDNINVHKYGPHVFHTNDRRVWDYVNRFAEFEQFQLNVIANYQNKLYNLPFNMNTFYQMWGVKTKEEAIEIINSQKFQGDPKNLEEYALSMVGEDIYRILIYGYTKKQWNTHPLNLPKSIIARLPLRFSFDNNYFNHRYQGIPKEGYTKFFENLLDGIKVELGIDFLKDKNKFKAKRIVYTGPIDAFYGYCHGKLDYRSLKFEHTQLNQEVYQGCPTMNFTEEDVPYTRIIEHKFFSRNKTNSTIITKEIPQNYTEGTDPFYPINDQKNSEILKLYKEIDKFNQFIFGGRLAEYKYYDMDQTVASALHKIEYGVF